VANKITRIINCAGREIPNAWERSGVRYLTFYWPEAGNCIIFDDTNSVLDDLYAFIEEALDVADSVLIHSTDGQSRACFCAAVFFMLKYKWCVPGGGWVGGWGRWCDSQPLGATRSSACTQHRPPPILPFHAP
jgi:hypothetical protein